MATLEELQRQLVQLKVKKAVRDAQQRRLAGERDPAYDPTAGMGTVEKLAVGNSAGFQRGLKGLVNLALPDSLTPEFASDANLAEQDQLDAALKNTTAGGIGSMIGEVGSTLPIGGGSGSLAKMGLKPGASFLLKTLGSVPVRGAVEGGITGAALSAPDERGENATFGAGIGGGLGFAGKVLGRLGRGLGQKSTEARNLEFLAAQHGETPFIPVAQAIGDDSGLISRVVKSIYKEGLPYTPGVTGQLQNQGRQLADTFRRVALKEADHFKVLTPAMLKNTDAAVGALRSAINKAYEPVKKHLYSLPTAATQERHIIAQLKRSFPTIDNTTLGKAMAPILESLNRFSNGTMRITGDNLLNAKNQISRAIAGMQGPEKVAAVETVNMIERLLKQQTPGAAFESYVKANAAHADARALERSIKGINEFGPEVLFRNSARAPNQRQVARTYGKVLKGTLGLPGAAGRWIARGATAALGAYSLPVAAAGLGAANLAGTKTAQKLVMGDTALQQLLVKALNKDEEARRLLGSAFRTTQTAQLGEE